MKKFKTSIKKLTILITGLLSLYMFLNGICSALFGFNYFLYLDPKHTFWLKELAGLKPEVIGYIAFTIGISGFVSAFFPLFTWMKYVTIKEKEEENKKNKVVSEIKAIQEDIKEYLKYKNNSNSIESDHWIKNSFKNDFELDEWIEQMKEHLKKLQDMRNFNGIINHK